MAIYTEPDRYGLFVKRADEAYSLGEDPLAGYLHPARIVNLAWKLAVMPSIPAMDSYQRTQN